MSRTPYPSPLTDAQWANIARLVPEPRPGGRPAKYPRREVVDGILSVARTGGAWRSLPTDLPSDRIGFHYFRLWQRDGTWGRIHAALREKVRRAAGKKRRPATGILDSQGKVNAKELKRLKEFARKKTGADGSSELGFGLPELRTFMDANFERAAGRRRLVDRALMNGEWPVLLKVMGKDGPDGRYLGLREVEDLFTKRQLPLRMNRQLKGGRQ